VRVFELVVAVLLAAAGVRSLWSWSRRRFEGTDPVDHLLYAAFVTGRVGTWFAVAGLFLIYAGVHVQGRAALDELEAYRWYLLVPLVLVAMQFVGGWFLGRRDPTGGLSRRP
jgi:hypothetical protein